MHPAPRRYAVLVLVVEFIGLSAVVPYGLLLPLYTASSGSRGLPLDDGRVVLPPGKRFRVHILVPCYKVRARACSRCACVCVCVCGVCCMCLLRVFVACVCCVLACASHEQGGGRSDLNDSQPTHAHAHTLSLTHARPTRRQESLEVITNTVTAALAAEVPPGVTRTLYLCDDGKDAAKRAFIATLGDEAR
jgi:hypothetical protein